MIVNFWAPLWCHSMHYWHTFLGINTCIILLDWQKIQLRMSWGVWAIFFHYWLMTLLFHNCRIDTVLPHTAKNRCSAACIRATVTPNRSLFWIPPWTSLIHYLSLIFQVEMAILSISHTILITFIVVCHSLYQKKC